MSSTDEWTIGRLLTWTTEFLTERGSDTPRLDAEVLLAAARECERIELYTAFSEIAEEPLRVAFRELVRRRAEGTPVAYLVGHREFYSLSFRVNDHVLIPRPETEFVVMTLLDKVKEGEYSKPQIVDVGTGSGVIAVCAARHLSAAEVTAIDISSQALEIAQLNAEHHDTSVRFVEGDLLEPVEGESFDFILSNPPYVSEAEYDELDPGVRDQEPKLALLGGPQGTEIIQRLIPAAASQLKSQGWLIIEISPMIHRAVGDLIEADGRFATCEIIKDLAGLERVIAAQRC